MNIELENDGKRCTKFKINGQDFGDGISELEIRIIGGEKPVIKMQGRIENLNAIIDHCNIMMKKEGKQEYKHIGDKENE